MPDADDKRIRSIVGQGRYRPLTPEESTAAAKAARRGRSGVHLVGVGAIVTVLGALSVPVTGFAGAERWQVLLTVVAFCAVGGLLLVIGNRRMAESTRSLEGLDLRGPPTMP